MTRVFRKYGIFLIIPGIVLGLSVLLKLASGPYWLATNLDPSYQYLVNGVYLLKGIVPNHSDHPGTPLQMLFCAVFWLFNMGRPAGDVVTYVLKDPEFYLQIVFVIVSLFSFFTSVALSVYVYRKTGDKLAALLIQLPALSFLTLKSWVTFEPVLPVVANISPEPLLVGVLNLFNLCLLMNFFEKPSTAGRATTLGWGMVCGLGVAVKLTFLPLVVVPLIVLSWRNKFLFLGIFAASFVLWTLPIISKYPIIWGWISGIAMHKSSYGAAGNGVGEISSYFLNWKNIVLEQWAFIILLAAASILIIWKFVRKEWDRASSFLAATIVGVCCQFSAVTQHPGAHYLLPGLGLFSILLVLFYWQSMSHHALGRRIAGVFILTCVLAGVGQAMEYRVKLAGLSRDILDFQSQASTKYQNCTIIDYYRSSDQAAALFFGDGWNLSPHLGQELFKLYPDKYYFHIWGNTVLNFDGRVWTNDLLAKSSCVIFQGDGAFDFSNGPFDLQLLQKGRFESTYFLAGTTEKQAAILLAGAVRFFQAGDYQKAMMCALQARKFHYQPDSSVENLIRLFKPYLPGYKDN